MMYSLLYTSNATQPFSQDGLGNLLARARSNNAANEITGILLYSGGAFVQLLEGPQSAVDDTFNKIAQDNRHHNIEVVASSTGEARYFPAWQMGFKWMSTDDLKRIDNIENPDIKRYFKASEPFKMIKLLSRGHWQL